MTALSETEHLSDVYYLIDNPEFDFDPRGAISRPFDLLNLNQSKQRIKRELYVQRMKNHISMMESLSNQKKTSIINPIDMLCGSKYCDVIIDDKLIYSDDDHLSRDGSFFLSEKLEPLLFPQKNVNSTSE